MKHLWIAVGLLWGAGQAHAEMDCKSGGTGPGAPVMDAKLAPNFAITDQDISIDLIPSGFDALNTTAEIPQMQKQAKCTGSWEGVVHLPYFGRFVGVEYNVYQATFDFLDVTPPSNSNDVLKALGGDIYIKGKAIVDGKEDVFEKDLKLPSDQDKANAVSNQKSVFPLEIFQDFRILRENNSVCGRDIKIHLDEISANVKKGKEFAFASASLVLPGIRLTFIEVQPGDPECVNR